jgi:putative pyruvate formate lyase activating enzyme
MPVHLPAAADPMVAIYSRCSLCPRACGADRSAGETGFCGETAEVRAASALLHFGEEPPITGAGGSGTVFFTGCTLQCRFCQNRQVSREGMGSVLCSAELSSIFIELERAGAENLNIVTGSHFAPGILGAYLRARAEGVSIPLVWNSSGYETPETIALVSPHTRFFLPDLKTLSTRLASRWLDAPDYPAIATRAVLTMAEALPLVREGDAPRQGVILRHLVLPGNLEDTRAVLAWFKENLDGRAMLSLMFQYTPVPGFVLDPPFDRMTSPEEYRRAVGMLEELSIEDGYVQEPETDGEWLPDFGKTRPFPSGKSRVVWHFMDRAR